MVQFSCSGCRFQSELSHPDNSITCMVCLQWKEKFVNRFTANICSLSLIHKLQFIWPPRDIQLVRLLIILLLCMNGMLFAQATSTTSITATQYIDYSPDPTPGQNNVTGSSMRAYWGGAVGSSGYTTLIQFNMANVLPTGATLNSATLSLTTQSGEYNPSSV